MPPNSILNTDVPVLDQDGVGDLIGQLPATNATEKQFTVLQQYTTMLAEYRFEGDDIIIHFFPTPEIHQLADGGRAYWLQQFPAVFEPLVFSYFGAQPPRVQAQLIEGVVPSFEEDGSKGTYSWMLRANAFTNRIDPTGFVERFVQKLDQALDPLMR